jgi:hypothetical protein
MLLLLLIGACYLKWGGLLLSGFVQQSSRDCQ